MKIRIILQTGLVLIAFGIFIILYTQERNNPLLKGMVKIEKSHLFTEAMLLQRAS